MKLTIPQAGSMHLVPRDCSHDEAVAKATRAHVCKQVEEYLEEHTGVAMECPLMEISLKRYEELLAALKEAQE